MSRQPVSKYHANKALVNINLLNGKNKNIVKNPGCAFATGNHFTNRLCISEISRPRLVPFMSKRPASTT